ncbi:DNA polymerase III subunit beta [Tuanshanicoccus lijuaniae]|uniref:DNA polymerase III subunit beta n=1 Tax=Aerococcaceae bacterium zg-1292 TaxID=2774330 RepID=UPI001BD8E74C|nr:DNA polymerase III subunit beta [Aerococcaceae bacterium zg-BR22]MBS4456337.1 DNA polymerase III subunit beta [Aerococcaceae bacterium zg-A91]MBS4458247.1 DNA polymerase III subunit beta [Aerococcaceae bacterium zg-BR33]
MKFTMKRTVFMTHLSHVTRAVPSKTTIDILKGIKLEVQSDKLILIGSNSDISIESVLLSSDEMNELNIEETGSVILPARLINDIVRKLPTNTIEIEVDSQYLIIVKSGKAVFTIIGGDASTYPQLPIIESNVSATFSTTVFNQMIAQTIFSASNQETRPVLTGIHLTNHGDYLSAVASDSHRLSKREIPFPEGQQALPFESIDVPKKTMLELMRIAEDEQTLSMVVAEQQVIFSLDGITIYSRLLEGIFPDAERLIPTHFISEITLNASQFLNSIDRTSLLSTGTHKTVQMIVGNNTVNLFVKGNEVGMVAEEIEVKQIEGEEIKVSFNAEYMKDALKSFEDADVKIQLQSAARPFVIQLATPSELENNNLLQLLTPIRTHG